MSARRAPLLLVTGAALAACAGQGPGHPAEGPPPVLDTGAFRHDQHLALEEDGQPLTCGACHRVQPEAAYLTVRPGQDEHAPCDRCHAQAFFAAPGPLCASCHAAVDPTQKGGSPLKPFPRQGGRAALVASFDHSAHLKRNKDRVPAGGSFVCEACHQVPDTAAAYASFPRHDTCATCHEKVASPRIAECGACHEGDGPTQARRFLLNDVRFTHGKHRQDAQGQRINCVTCHYEVERSERAADLNLPQMKDCATCHEDGARTPEAARISNCGLCHTSDVRSSPLPGNHTAERALPRPSWARVQPTPVDPSPAPRLSLTATAARSSSASLSLERFARGRGLALDQPRPEDHTPLFARRHERAARSSDAKCSYCHEGLSGSSRDACRDCHATTRPRDHGLRWLSTAHGRAAAADAKRCATCHEVDTCTSCHQTPPRSHFPLESFRTRHNRSARANVSACLTCHSFESTCATCHGVPLGAGRVASARQGLSGGDWGEKLIARAGLGFTPTQGVLSGERTTQGLPARAEEYRTRSLPLGADLALGTRRLGLPTLNTYLLGKTALDAAGEVRLGEADEVGRDERYGATTGLLHRYPGARALWLELAYAELAGLSEDGALSHVVLRAGRQHHAGAAAVSFDGATLGWDDGRLAILLYGGRRAAVYARGGGDPGFLAGGTVSLELGERGGLPLSLRGEVLHFRRELELSPPDRRLEGAAAVTEASTLVLLGGEYRIQSGLLVHGELTMLAPSPSRVRLGAELALGPALLLLELEQKLGADLTYDLAAGPGRERGAASGTLETYRLGVPDLAPYSAARAALLLPFADSLELTLGPSLRYVLAPAEERSPFDASRLGVEAGLHGRFVLGPDSGLYADLEYAGSFFLRQEALLGTFRDDDAGPERMAHEGALRVGYTRGGRFVRRRMLGAQTLKAELSAFARYALVDNRLIRPLPDSVFGGRAALGWAFTDYTRLDLAYELARDSTLFVPELGLFHAVFARVEAHY